MSAYQKKKKEGNKVNNRLASVSRDAFFVSVPAGLCFVPRQR